MSTYVLSDIIDEQGSSGKRVLRPRSEARSYAESPDIVLLPAAPPHRKPLLPAGSTAPFTGKWTNSVWG